MRSCGEAFLLIPLSDLEFGTEILQWAPRSPTMAVSLDHTLAAARARVSGSNAGID